MDSFYLNTERRQAERAGPREFGMLEMFLDRDGDGEIMDDVADIATNVLGNLFRPR